VGALRDDILLLTADEVRRCLDPELLRDAIRHSLIVLSRGEASVPLRISADAAKGSLDAMPAFVPGSGLGAKLISFFPDNPSRGLPVHVAVVVLFDDQTGSLLAFMDGTSITAERTAATTAVATDLLARRDASTLAIIGAGVQAESHLRHVSLVRPFSDIRVASRSERTARELADAWPNARAVPTVADALSGADVVCACTGADAPILQREWIEHGAHVSSVGMGPEVDAATVRDGRLFAESRASALAPYPSGAGELKGVDPASIAELGEVLLGLRPGRTSPEALTVFKSVGNAAEDVATARLVYEGAVRLGLGRPIGL
jgi:ornithine cyclodeaminase/alanine dehydrogenase-like protein (mu-crystallin family)